MSAAVFAAKPDVALSAPRARVSLIDTIVKPLRQWMEWRETVTALRAINPRVLRDIGVEADIEGYAWKMTERR